MWTRLGYKARSKKQKWMTDEIMLLMDERPKYKNVTDDSMHRNIQRLIRTKINSKERMAQA